MLVKKQQLELDMEQQTGSKSGKVQIGTCHLTSTRIKSRAVVAADFQ